jgi:hypothetical protein
MTDQEQQKRAQPQIVKETDHAFAPSPRTEQREDDSKTKPEIPETIPTPEKDIDHIN